MTTDYPLRIREVQLLERPVRLRLPFRYGSVTLREAPQAFARVRVQCGAASAWGIAAEMLAPKWFDKDPALSDADNMEQLRHSLATAAAAYLAAEPASAFGHSLGAGRAAAAHCARQGLNALVSGFGAALMDRAVLDALARLAGASFFAVMAANLPGIRLETLAPDLADFDSTAFLAGLVPRTAIEARHTVGLLDPLTDAELGDARVDDGLPESLQQVLAFYRQRWFKVKIGGDVARDLDRLAAVADVLGGPGAQYRITLDGNEQYASTAALQDFIHGLEHRPELAGFRQRIALLEQPLARHLALDVDLDAAAIPFPLIIDESDDAPDAFLRARARGYRGISSKSCKGLYKALANAARCARWNTANDGPRFFMTGEDLTCQGGVCVQQDLALAALLGLEHVERNGHHFAGPMPGAPAAEHRAFLDAHPDLYREHAGRACLRIDAGRIALDSLRCTGFAHAADPDLSSLSELTPPERVPGVL